jgi:ketosteroid isomerase-like protein
MTHPNAELVQHGYHAFAKGDIPTALGLFAQDISWHIPGRSPLSGDYKGHEQVVAFLTKSMELSDGTLRIDVHEILSEGERTVVLCTVSAERNGQFWSSPEIHVWRLVNSKAVEFREFQGDQQTEDEFWMSQAQPRLTRVQATSRPEQPFPSRQRAPNPSLGARYITPA